MQQNLSPSSVDEETITNEDGCTCGETKCVKGKLWRCMDLGGDGTCIWFITDEDCTESDKA